MVTPALVEHLKAAVTRLKENTPSTDDLIDETPAFASWMVRAELLIESIGPQGQLLGERLRQALDPTRYASRLELVRSGERSWNGEKQAEYVNTWRVEAATGIIDALATALDHGLLDELAVRVASEIYSDVLSEAERLLNQGHLPCAAILTRVGVESGLRRRAVRDGMTDAEKTSISPVNDWLWKQGTYPKATHDMVEAWLAVGNAFAHNLPERQQYDGAAIARTLRDVRAFLAILMV